MTRVSEYYQLGRTQPTLDFVDVDVRDDVRVFLDPRAFRLLQSDWGEQCRDLLHTFFAEVLRAITAGDTTRARALLSRLREPNETHLGFSAGASRGHGLGRESGQGVADALSASRAARTGLLQDLEDTVLLVPRIGHDVVSDITTNVLRGPLIAYTRQQADLHGIPTAQVASGPVWNPAGANWEEGFVELPAPEHRKLLLVPKALVRYRMDFDKDEYYGDYLIPMLQDEELSKPGSELVEMLKKGPRVTKKSIKEKYGTSKDAIAALTATHREALDGYREQKGDYVSPPLDHDTLSELTQTAPIDLHALLDAVRSVPAGKRHATDFHLAAEALLSALLYPALIDPQVEYDLHERRKRVDIRYTNAARSGFFAWLIRHRVPSQHVFVECKNYTGDPANPELDQLSGRFSPLRGQVGLLVCRTFRNKVLFLDRCRDTAQDQRGFCIALDDDDLAQMVNDAQEEREAGSSVPTNFRLLKQRYDKLIKLTAWSSGSAGTPPQAACASGRSPGQLGDTRTNAPKRTVRPSSAKILGINPTLPQDLAHDRLELPADEPDTAHLDHGHVMPALPATQDTSLREGPQLALVRAPRPHEGHQVIVRAKVVSEGP